PNSKANIPMVADLFAHDLANVLKSARDAAIATISDFFDSAQHAAMADRTLEEKLTKLLGEDNLQILSAVRMVGLLLFLATKVESQPARRTAEASNRLVGHARNSRISDH